MKNKREIYQALLDGKKIISIYNCLLYLGEDGSLLNNLGKPTDYFFNDPENWTIYEEPKIEEKFYYVVAKSIMSVRPIMPHKLYRSKEEFLQEFGADESEYEWIDLKEFNRSET